MMNSDINYRVDQGNAKYLEESSEGKNSNNLDVLLDQYKNLLNDLELKKEDKGKIEIDDYNPDQILVGKKTDLTNQIKSLQLEIKRTQNSIVGAIQEEDIFDQLKVIQKTVSSEFAFTINNIIMKNKELKKAYESNVKKEVAKIYKIKADTLTVGEKTEGKQEGFIIKSKTNEPGEKFYQFFVKHSKISETKHIDPKELFAYKVLEEMEIGPEVHFVIPAGSSNATGSHICHIVTKDLAFSEEGKNNIFHTDGLFKSEIPENSEEKLQQWKDALASSEFRKQFIKLSIVNDLLHLNDCLATNFGNYGNLYVVSSNEYRAAIVDHEIKNSMFKYKPDLHPIKSLLSKLEGNYTKNKSKGELISYKLIQEKKYFANSDMQKDELEYVLTDVIKTIDTAIENATTSIINTINENKEHFADNADKILHEYIKQTMHNIIQLTDKKEEYLEGNADMGDMDADEVIDKNPSFNKILEESGVNAQQPVEPEDDVNSIGEETNHDGYDTLE